MADTDPDAVRNAALRFIKSHVSLLIQTFASFEQHPREVRQPVSVFMAGSPGAGKTEISQRFVETFRQRPVLIDADEIRQIIPGYTGANASEVQGAAALGVEKLYDWALAKHQNVILDGTFSDLAKARLNLERSLGKGREVHIMYVYQDPLVAWEITKKREQLEGRVVPQSVFINAYLGALEVVKTLKREFQTKVSPRGCQKCQDRHRNARTLRRSG